MAGDEADWQSAMLQSFARPLLRLATLCPIPSRFLLTRDKLMSSFSGLSPSFILYTKSMIVHIDELMCTK